MVNQKQVKFSLEEAIARRSSLASGRIVTLATGVFDILHIEPDYDLNIMQPGQSLTEITRRALVGLEEPRRSESPDMALVQGDTTTAFVGGLAAFYHQTPIGHIEAGLRTRDKYNPYTKEVNRHFLDVLAY